MVNLFILNIEETRIFYAILYSIVFIYNALICSLISV